MTATIHVGDSRDVLATLPAASVQTCVTSPPYFGLRDYGHAGQIGLEATVDEYVAALVDVFRGVRRVLKDDGTVWLNLGDSYAASATGADTTKSGLGGGKTTQTIGGIRPDKSRLDGLKPKDLIGIPWRVAFALQADGWYLRSEIIWHKPNPMPESVRDRPTKSHEQVFLLSKQPRYYYDAAAIAEPAIEGNDLGLLRGRNAGGEHAALVAWHAQSIKSRQDAGVDSRSANESGMRNKRSVWTVATQPFSEAHFATFPPKLIEPCILAGTSEKGHCPDCGKTWVRVVERTPAEPNYVSGKNVHNADRNDKGRTMFVDGGVRTVGWEPQCTCGADPVPDVVLDPFSGAGTTGLVADRLGRNYVGVELNPEYAEMSRKRLTGDAPLFASVEIA